MVATGSVSVIVVMLVVCVVWVCVTVLPVTVSVTVVAVVVMLVDVWVEVPLVVVYVSVSVLVEVVSVCVTLVIVEVLVVLVVVIQQGSAQASLQPSITATDEQVKRAKAKLSQVAAPLQGAVHKLLGHPSGGSTATTRPISSHADRGTIKQRLHGAMARSCKN